jgi:phage terminase large subunit-like protein
MNNYILEYYEKIKSGNINVSKKILAVYKKIIPIINGEDPKYYYDEKKGQKIILFIENFCNQSKGIWAGEPLNLLLFQKAKLQVIFGILNRETKLRKYKEVFDVRGRKNGKSVENSAVALYLLTMDKEKGAEIYCAATVMSQAKRVWEESKNMVAQNKDLSKIVKSRTFPTTELYIPKFMSVYKPLSKNIDTFDGLNASAAIID